MPTAFDNIFKRDLPIRYNLRRINDKVSLPSRRLKKWGTDTIRYQGAIIHNYLVDLGFHSITFNPVVKNKLKSMYLSSYVWKGIFCCCFFLQCSNTKFFSSILKSIFNKNTLFILSIQMFLKTTYANLYHNRVSINISSAIYGVPFKKSINTFHTIT